MSAANPISIVEARALLDADESRQFSDLEAMQMRDEMYQELDIQLTGSGSFWSD